VVDQHKGSKQVNGRGVNRRALQAMLLAGVIGLVSGAGPVRAGLPEVVEAIKSSVLPVGSYNALKSPRFNFHGTGFVVGNGNLLVTNAHVLPSGANVDLDAKLMVLLPRATGTPELRAASVVDTDPVRDLALLRIDGSPLPALRLGDSASVREGQAVALMGFPMGGALGFRTVTHRGIVASIANVAPPAPTSRQLDELVVRQLREGPLELLQLDAIAYPGNSGGPLFDPDTGLVLGVLSMGLLKSTREAALSQPTGISYAVPVRHVLNLLKDR